MIIRDLKELAGTEREVSAEGWTSRRLLLKRDGTDFSMHDTLIHAGADLTMHYKHHLEAVYCVGGEGSLEDLATGERWEIRDGMLYTLNGHERHRLRARTEMRMICVFTPALTGQEVHGKDGAYPVLETA